MVKKILILAVCSFIVKFTVAQQVDCRQFKEGKFRINDNRAGGVIIAERRGGFQTETMDVLKATVRFKITWQNDCSYTLTLDKVLRNDNKVPFPSNMKVSVKIIAVENNTSYTQQISSSLVKSSYKVEVLKTGN